MKDNKNFFENRNIALFIQESWKEIKNFEEEENMADYFDVYGFMRKLNIRTIEGNGGYF